MEAAQDFPFVQTGDDPDGSHWEVRGRRGLTLTEHDGGHDLGTDPVRSFQFDETGTLVGWRSGVVRVTVARTTAGGSSGCTRRAQDDPWPCTGQAATSSR